MDCYQKLVNKQHRREAAFQQEWVQRFLEQQIFKHFLVLWFFFISKRGFTLYFFWCAFFQLCSLCWTDCCYFQHNCVPPSSPQGLSYCRWNLSMCRRSQQNWAWQATLPFLETVLTLFFVLYISFRAFCGSRICLQSSKKHLNIILFPTQEHFSTRWCSHAAW